MASAATCGLAPAAWAQSPPATAPEVEAAPSATGGDSQIGEIVVTGSRISQNGYQATTPVTVAVAADLIKASPTALADGLNKLPQFVGSAGPSKVASNMGQNPNHGNILNLRGIGPNRTLILLDGVRASPTTYLNTVDVDLLPTLLVQRVDVVTAGASSVYGSDAVSGVVNFVLDSKYVGVKGVAQGGIASRGDNQNARFGLAAGTALADNRLHLIGSVDFNFSDGFLNRDRPTLRDISAGVGSTTTGVAGTATNPVVQIDDARSNFATFGGLATSGPFINTNFVSPGVYAPLNRGTATGSPSFFRAPSDYVYQGIFMSAGAYSRNISGFGRATYDIGGDTEIYAQALVAQSKIRYQGFPNLFFTTTVLPIFSGNPYIPAALQQQLTATNTASFNVAKLFTELGPIKTKENIRQLDFRGGMKGKVGGFTWQFDYTHGDSVYKFAQRNQFDLLKLSAATDAVVDPSSGKIVCRPSLSVDAAVRANYAGCVPINILGFGAATPEAAAYAFGTSIYRATNVTNDVTATVSGNLFDLPAGPLGLSVGAEYRNASLNLTSNSDPAVRRDTTGLRGISATTVRFYLSNVATARGKLNVKEAFAELAIPILKDAPIARRLDLNAAARITDYSTSGSVKTWKVGGTWTPIDDIKFRATRSRDIRAPTLFDLYAGSQFTQGSVLDPHTGISTGFNQITSGNRNLKAEIGETFTAGVVLQPSFLRGVSASVDYYKVKIKGAISTLTALAILQDCEASNGTAPSCANVQRPLPFSDRTAANFPTQITVSGINASLISTAGLDFDLSYQGRIGEGRFSARVYATRLDSFKTQLASGQATIDYAGYNAAGSGGVTGGLPKWKGTLSLNYEIGRFGLFMQENYISSLKFGPVLIYADPHIPAFYTTDMTASYKLRAFGGDIELFGTVTNLFDRAAPPVRSTGLAGLGGTIVSLYDTNGTAFVGGARFKF
jgi:outer membrane receptor protein involved in Fe transport